MLLITALSCAVLSAQTGSGTNYEPVSNLPAIGVKAGLNLSRIAGDDAYDSSDSSWGWHLGAFTQYNLISSVCFQPELIYSQKGYNYKFSTSEINTKVDDSYDYLEVPLLIKLNLNVPGVKIQPYVGPSIAYLVSATSKITDTIGSTSITREEKIRSDMRAFDLGINLGADVILVNRVMLGARYNFGISKIYKDSKPGIGTDVQNGVFMLNVGLLFTI